MFDNVGKDLDREAGRRQALSVLITLTLLGSIGGATMIYGAFMVGRAVVEALDTEPMLEATLEEDVLPEDAPPPPPPPPPASGAQEEEEDDTTPEQTEPTEEVKELDEKVDDTIKAQDAPKGAVGGVEGGVEGGVVGGVIGGVVGGTGTTLGGVKTFHHSDMRWKRPPNPVYPDAARDLNLPETECKVLIKFDEQGTPVELEFKACPKVFQEAARTAIMSSRMYPQKVAGAAVKGQFVLNLLFKLT